MHYRGAAECSNKRLFESWICCGRRPTQRSLHLVSGAGWIPTAEVNKNQVRAFVLVVLSPAECGCCSCLRAAQRDIAQLNLLLLIWVVLDPVVIVVVVVVVEACFLPRSLNFSCRVVVSLSL